MHNRRVGWPGRDRDAFRVLFVCTGNVCRSPFAEILTRHLLIGGLGGRAASRFRVESAGVRAVVGAQMDHDTRDELMPWGLDGASLAGLFLARQLTAGMISDSDLILGAGQAHRGAVVERLPEARRTTFTLREFARLVADVDPRSLPDEPAGRAGALVEQAWLRRGVVPGRRGGDEVPDPIGGDPAAHRRATTLIADAVTTIVRKLVPTGGYQG